MSLRRTWWRQGWPVLVLGLGLGPGSGVASSAAAPVPVPPADTASAGTNAPPVAAPEGDEAEGEDAATDEGAAGAMGENAEGAKDGEGQVPPAENDEDTGTVRGGETGPYQVFVARNPFGLKPMPPPAPVTTEPPPTPVNLTALKLTGITTMLGGKRAMFVLQEPGKPQLNSDLVAEGERDSSITNLEVLQIDERSAVVRVMYGGKELAMNFQDHGLKPPVGPAPGAPGAPGTPGAPRPGVAPGAVPVASAGAMGSGMPGATPAGVGGVGAGASGLRSIPARPTRLPVGASSSVGGGFQSGAMNQPVQDVVQVNTTPEQQALIMRAQEEISRQQGVPFPPSPPLPGAEGGAPPVDYTGQEVPRVRSRFPIPAPPSLPGMPQQ